LLVSLQLGNDTLLSYHAHPLPRIQSIYTNQIQHIQYFVAMPDGQHIEYQPLSSEQKQIRTIILYAGKVRDPIRCDLRIVSLADNPPYEALSYTWGDASVTEPIDIGGVDIKATVDLERALRLLRVADSDLTLWVDAGEFFAMRDARMYILTVVADCSVHQSGRHQ
jgi:hypothetical protein